MNTSAAGTKTNLEGEAAHQAIPASLHDMAGRQNVDTAEEIASKQNMVLGSTIDAVAPLAVPAEELSADISIEDLHIGPSNARKRDVPSTSWSEEANQAFRQKLEPDDTANEGESKLATAPHKKQDIDDIKLTQMQLSDRQNSHAQATTLATPLPIKFSNGHGHDRSHSHRWHIHKFPGSRSQNSVAASATSQQMHSSGLHNHESSGIMARQNWHEDGKQLSSPHRDQHFGANFGPVSPRFGEMSPPGALGRSAQDHGSRADLAQFSPGRQIGKQGGPGSFSESADRILQPNKRAAPLLSVSEPSDSPLKRRLMRSSGSESNLKSLSKRALPSPVQEIVADDSSGASRSGGEDQSHDASPVSLRQEESELDHRYIQSRLDGEGLQELEHAKLLINRSKHAEALAILQALAIRFSSNPDILCQTGICYGLANNRAQAFACFATAMEGFEGHVESMVACAALYKSCGLIHEAVDLLRKAFKLQSKQQESPDIDSSNGKLELSDIASHLALALSDLGTKIKASGNAEEGLKLYEEALEASPDQPQVLYNIGVLHSEKSDGDKALEFYGKAVAIYPGYAEAHCNMGVICKSRGQCEVAIKHYRNALKASPNFKMVRANMAIALAEMATSLKCLGQIDQSIEMFEEALVYDCKCAEALYNLAVVYSESKQMRRAAMMYELCLVVKPDCAEAHNNLGVLYRSMGNLEKSFECYMSALQINPKFHQALSNVAVIYTTQGKAQEAHQFFVAAIMACPDYAEAYNNLGVLQRDVGQVQLAIESYEKCIELDTVNDVNAGQNRLLALNYIYPGEDAFVCKEHAAWGLQFQERHNRLPKIAPETWKTNSETQLVIGYVSPDFYTHSVSYFAEAPLTHHTKRVKVKAFSCCMHQDSKTERLQAAVQQIDGDWLDCAEMTDESMAKRIREAKVDILVDLTGHTAYNRLGVFAMKPAPIQVTWIGYPNSTGLGSVDYRFTDAVADLPDTTQTFVEEVVRLPDCFLCYTPAQDAPPVSDLPAHKLGFITFGSFNALSKITGHVIEVWAKILMAVPRSRLVLKNKPFACPHAQQYFLNQFTAHGVTADRIDLLPLTAGNKQHLETYSMMDISLDPWPYAGTTTTCESLFMGVPCLSLKGSCHAHNVGASLLTCLGIDGEWLASCEEEYISMAIKAASDLPRLAKTRRTLRDCFLASPLCDTSRFIQNLEDQYFELYDRWKRDC